ncbi:MAG: HAD family phosphatase [Clostridia bacterium]|nr:HAD family phosphatase [Clostridia bacterium]
MIKEIKGAIFDLDGTIIDSMGVWEKVDFDFLNKRNIPVPEDVSSIIKNMTFQETAVYFKQRFQLPDDIQDIMDEWNQMAYHEYANNVRLKPGAGEYLSMLKSKGIKAGLATSNCMELIQPVLKNNDVLEYFDVISTIDEVDRDKNFPDIYILTARRLQLNPKHCIVFEDILPGVLSAKKAGMKTVGVYDRYSRHEKKDIKKHADYFIYDFCQLLD